jgi:hypothetical protein
MQAVDVAGGQYWYVDPRDGALRYTEAPILTETNGTAVGWNATVPHAPVEGQEFAGQRVSGMNDPNLCFLSRIALTHGQSKRTDSSSLTHRQSIGSHA